MIFLKAFIVGGIICALVQIVIDKTKVTPARIMVSLVCIGVVLGAIGIYEPLTKWAGCGATVPLLGFGNNLWKGMKEAIDESGFLGLFKGKCIDEQRTALCHKHTENIDYRTLSLIAAH